MAAMVIPETVMALVARTPRAAFWIEGDIGRVVDFTVRMAITVVAYHIVCGRIL